MKRKLAVARLLALLAALAADLRLDGNPAAVDRDHDPTHARLVARVEVALPRLAELHLRALADKDHVAHRQARVEVRAEPGQRTGAGRVRVVDVGRQLAGELLLHDDDAVLRADLLQLSLQQGEKVELHVGRRLGARDRAEGRRATVGGDLLAPERHLLKPNEICLRALDLSRERRRPLRELGALELVPHRARAVNRFRDARGLDRRGEIRAQEQVPSHDGDLRPALALRGRLRGGRNGERSQRHEGKHELQMNPDVFQRNLSLFQTFPMRRGRRATTVTQIAAACCGLLPPVST